MPSTNGSLVSAAVQVTLDGRELLLRYSALAFIRYAEVLDRDLLADFRELGQQAQEAQVQGIDFAKSGKLLGSIRDMLWAALIDRQPEIDREQVARLFGYEDLGRIMPAIIQAMRATNPATAAEPPRPTRAPKPRRLSGHSIDGFGSGPTSAPDAESQPANSAP
jgi:hypothetical protein